MNKLLSRFAFFVLLFFPSTLLSEPAYQKLIHEAQVIEQDKRGTKVALLKNGQYFKVFRKKSLFSSNTFYSYARSFCRNAKRLAMLGVPTINITQLYALETGEYAVTYEPLEGTTVLDLLKSKQLTHDKAELLGEFIAHLHDKGVLFKSLHFGNIVLMPNGSFGLIDIASMSIYPWRLGCKKRLKNFDGFWRTFEHKYMFGLEGIQAFTKGYHKSCTKVDLKLRDIQLRLM